MIIIVLSTWGGKVCRKFVRNAELDVKNIPIIGKFLAVLALFGVFVLGVAFYATSQLKKIDTDYSAIIDRDQATVLLARATRNMQTARAAIGDLVMATTDEGNRKSEDEFNTAAKKAENYMDEAAKASPSDAADIQALKA